ncbi:MAG: hypothetical protein IK093_18915 [Ruminiclostridium sp.]|nr:hypothetical protein [Ruminiclostridium sp.]
MKITTFDPMIATKDIEPVVRLFEELGFEKKHDVSANDGEKDVRRVRMKDSNGFHLDIAQIGDIPRDISLIRMNVDNFDEAYEYLIGKGFKNTKGDSKVETKTNVSAILASPSGFLINLVEHFKD